MQIKIKAFSMIHRGREKVAEQIKAHKYDRIFDYGNLNKLTRFKGTHPAVMADWISRFDWKHQLRFEGPTRSLNPGEAKHDKIKYKIISWIEKRLLQGRIQCRGCFVQDQDEFRNYILLKR